jgi:glycosyltransferase involved in cell wall biosynthesis
VLYAPGNQGPVFLPCRFAVLIQNVDPMLQHEGPTSHSLRIKKWALRWMTKLSVERAHAVIAISDYTRRLLYEHFGSRRRDIIVIPHGRPEDADLPLAPDASERANRLISGTPYFLAVSDIKYNKGYETLVEAFGIAFSSERRCHLIIAGAAEDEECLLRVKELIRKHNLTESVHLVGSVAPDILRGLYHRSTALIFPSTVESFGLPPLEAMTYGVPVAASDIEPIREVCGDSICYFHPGRPQELAETMTRLLDDTSLRSELVRKGKERAQRFDWTETARETLTVLKAAAAS